MRSPQTGQRRRRRRQRHRRRQACSSAAKVSKGASRRWMAGAPPLAPSSGPVHAPPPPPHIHTPRHPPCPLNLHSSGPSPSSLSCSESVSSISPVRLGNQRRSRRMSPHSCRASAASAAAHAAHAAHAAEAPRRRGSDALVEALELARATRGLRIAGAPLAITVCVGGYVGGQSPRRPRWTQQQERLACCAASVSSRVSSRQQRSRARGAHHQSQRHGHRVARRALGGAVGSEATATIASRGARKVLVRLMLALHATREARWARRGTTLPCGCAPVHVKACVVQGR